MPYWEISRKLVDLESSSELILNTSDKFDNDSIQDY